MKKQGFRLWLEGARLRTLPLSVAPVLIGAASAQTVDSFNLNLTLLALAVALFLQIAVNFANDYSDGIRGTDDKRVGPIRLTGSKSVKPDAVKFVAFGFFLLAALSGLAIVLLTSLWWLLAVGAGAIVAAWFYTGGKSPYGYYGLGELAVFIFFGLVATIGTTYIQTEFIESNAVLGGAAIGSFSAAVLMVNNIRDLETDRASGKRTLAVMLGRKVATYLYLLMIWLPFLILALFALLYPATILGFFALLLVLPATLIVLTAKTARELILVLKLTSFAALGYGALLALGLFLVFI